MLDTLKLRVYGINSLKTDLQSEIANTNGFGSLFTVPEHNDLYKAMLAYKGRDFHMAVVKHREVDEFGDRDTDEFLTAENTNIKHVHQMTRQVMVFTDERKVKEVNLSINGTYRVPSSYNGVTFRINESAGFIDFQLSIPKYLYGHSLAEFIPQVNSELYDGNFYSAHSWRWQQDHIKKRLDGFIDIFINDICNHFQLECLLNKRYIGVIRLDLCFNQYFNNKTDSLRYLEHLKRINYKRYKANQKASMEYDSSLEYHSSTGAYFKVYHKGTEYSKSKDGDLKKHMDENRKWLGRIFKRQMKKAGKRNFFEGMPDNVSPKKLRYEFLKIMEEFAKGTYSPDNYSPEMKRYAKKLYRAMPYKTAFFKKHMDNVLRYEVSLTGQWFTYYYKHKIFRKDDPIHNNAYMRFLDTKNALHAKSAKAAPGGKELRNYKMMNGYLNRRIHLMLESSVFLKRYEKHGKTDYESHKDVYRVSKFGLANTMLADKDVGTFSGDILKFAVKHFKKMVDLYQVSAIDPQDDLENRINKYNQRVEDNIKAYNEKYHYKIYNNNGTQKTKGRLLITEAVQLLTQKQKVEMDLKKVRPLVLVTISDKMKKGLSLRQVRKGMKISNSQWSRYMKDLKKFDITEKTVVDAEPIETWTDWGHFYTLAGEKSFYDSFYVRKTHSYYG